MLVALALGTLGCSPRGSEESGASTPPAARDAARVPLGQGSPEPSAGAPPQVLVVLVDDLGWELFRSAPTPHLDAMAAQGVTFTQFWSAPKCGPTRASLLSGRFHFRIGDGEMARRHGRRSLGLDELLLPEVLGPELCAAFGKWHLSSGPEHPNQSGFGHFAGTLDNLNKQSYSSWSKIVDGQQSLSQVYPTTDVTNDAIASDAAFKYVCYHAPHTPFHDPPPDLTPTVLREAREAREARGARGAGGAGQGAGEPDPEHQVRAMVEALDTEIGRLLAAHPDALVIFLSDNGTTSKLGGEKGEVSERGINVPLIVRGPGVQRGVISDALVSVVDLFATVCELRGIAPPSEAEDSVSFAGVLRGEPGLRKWNYSCIFPHTTPGRRTHAIRDADYKLVVHYDRSRHLFAMPGEIPIDLATASNEILARVEQLAAHIP